MSEGTDFNITHTTVGKPEIAKLINACREARINNSQQVAVITMERKDLLFPEMNLQFFAELTPKPEPSPTPNPEPTPDPNPEPAPEPRLSVEEQLQQALIENEKLKRAQEKAASDAADWKKKYNATLTDAQKAAQDKAEKEAERQEQFDKLLKENTVNKLAKNFLKLGYPEDKAEEAANAQYDGDTETLFRIQLEIQESLIKQKEAEWLKSRPPVTTGAGDGETEDPFLKGFNSVGTKYTVNK